MALTIKRITAEDKTFYQLVGPFLGNRVVARELGGPVWNDPGKVWFVALDDNIPVGICAYVTEGRNARFCSDYVQPEHRDSGIYRQLFATRLLECASSPLVAIVTAQSLPLYLEHGFSSTGTRGQFTAVKRKGSE